MAPRRTLRDSPFDMLEKTFDLLVAEPNPLSFDGTDVDGLPDRKIPLDELQSILLHPATTYGARDATIAALVTRSQRHRGSDTIGLAGVLLPGLRRAVFSMIQAFPDKAEDIESEALVAFLDGVAHCEPGHARLTSRLTWVARNGASRLLRHEVAERAGPGNAPVSSAPSLPWGHPDLVLSRAVRGGVINKADAELISATRIGDLNLPEFARANELTYDVVRQRRLRAEYVLVAWMKSDEYLTFDVAIGALTPCSYVGDRPQRVRS